MKNSDNIINTIKDLYAIELIFADFRLNEVALMEEDRLFYIPYKNKRIELKNNLIVIFGRKYYKRVYHLICREPVKTLKDNSQDLEKLIKYSLSLIGE